MTYRTVHTRLESHRGKASAHQCVDCNATAHDWSYDGADPEAKRDRHGPYSTDLDRYQPRCRDCHLAFDRRLSTAA